CPSGAISVKDNLARIDNEKCTDCELCVEACPIGCIKVADFR
ncbi:MAG: 4Fe-4S binding protein, partial [Clostridia bacterium]|nr:4Fe-4S binding protein [Clostridia bacterium]